MKFRPLYFTIAILYVCEYARLCASRFINDDNLQPFEHSKRDVEETGGVHHNSIPEQSSQQTLSLDSILNLRVFDESQLCPRKNVIMFFTTGNLDYLSACREAAVRSQPNGIGQEQTSESTDTQPSEAEAGIQSYSGRLLKRILQNMNNGLPSAEQTGIDKRSRPRLSINVALTSLADMLRHQSRRHNHGHQYGFRQRLLNLG